MNSKPRITRSSNVKNVIALEKSKQCIVRLEDIKKQQKTSASNNSSTPQQQKAKPRILVQSAVRKGTPMQKIVPRMPQSAPPRQQHNQNIVKKKQHEDDLDFNIDTTSFGRSRRTPKPNVKYYNDSVVTLKPGKKLKIDDEEDEDADVMSSDGDFESKDDNASDFEITDEEDVPPAKKTRLSASATTTVRKSITPSALSGPPRRGVIAPVQKMLVKKPTVVEKPPVNVPANKKQTNIITYNTSNRNLLTRKRPLETNSPAATHKSVTNTQKSPFNQQKQPFNQQKQPFNQQKQPFNQQKQPINQQKQSFNQQKSPINQQKQISFNQQKQSSFNQQKQTSFIQQKQPMNQQKSPINQQKQPSFNQQKQPSFIQQKQPINQQKPPINQQKQNNVQPLKPKPATVTNNNLSVTEKSYTVVRRSATATVASPKQLSSTPTTATVKKVTTPPQINPIAAVKKKQPEVVRKEFRKEEEDHLEEDIENPMALNTIDDFEAMPTFTIVNINDIINKKGDVLMQQTFPNDEKKSDEKPESTTTKNRRKATHTVLKEEPSTKSPPPKTPFPPIVHKKLATPPFSGGPLKQIVMNKKIITPPKPQPPPPIKPTVQKPPVRILNSTLCRQQTPVTPIINAQKQQQQQKVAQPKAPSPPPTPPTVIKKEPQTSGIKRIVSAVKAAVNNKRPAVTTTTTTTPPTTTVPKRKLPEEKITVQKQGSKTIKKMTCFENWYVVHCAGNQVSQKPTPNLLTLPLIKIANSLQDICLPSEKWTSKVALSLIPDAVYQRGQFERYTGHYHDKSLVKDDIKHRYQPASILFRRSQKPNSIDRTVIMKNRTFLIYIQGKSVQLVGSPKLIKDIQDIESLLDCVDHLELSSEDVDVSPTAMNST